METTASLGRVELLRIAETVAQEKGIPAEEVIVAMEQAIQTAARRKYGQEHEILAEMDRKSGEIRIYRQLEVVEDIEDVATQIHLDDALARNPAAQIGDAILEPLPPIDLGRIAAQTAKQVIVQRVRDAERERQYEEFKDRIGEVVVGEVKRVEYGNVLVDLGRAEAICRRDEVIPREMFRTQDRIRAYVYDVRHETRGPQIFLSRTHPQFMAKLFAQEVPEIYDGIIEIKAVARDPGSRAKIAVISKDSSIDPVGACVGMRGSRVQAVVSELGGEKVDIIPWSPDPATFVVNALAPAEVSKVVLDPDAQRIEVVVPDLQQHIAIGRRGQNVRLASQLTGWDIDIISETEESERRNKEFREATEMFVEALNVEEVIAQLLATEGFTTVEDVAYCEVDDLAGVQGFGDEIAQALIDRANAYIQERDEAIVDGLQASGVDEDLINFESLTLDQIKKLADQGIKRLCVPGSDDDLAGLTGDELLEMLPGENLSEDDCNAIIMAARASLFPDEDADAGEPLDGEPVDESLLDSELALDDASLAELEAREEPVEGSDALEEAEAIAEGEPIATDDVDEDADGEPVLDEDDLPDDLTQSEDPERL
ncbi:MAG: transcription termination factor NusA [Geminicoccaceae bacterium]